MKKKQQTQIKNLIKKYWYIILIAVILIVVLFPNGELSRALGFADSARKLPDGSMALHFIDVGQGDSTFIELGNGKSMLIDAGTNSAQDIVVDYIKDLGYSEITYAVATHPHEDHIGGMDKVLENFRVENFYLPGVTSNTSDFEKMISLLEKNKIKVTEAKEGVVVYEDESLKIAFLSPRYPDCKKYSDLNQWSAVCKIDYGQKSFIIGGDATTPAEEAITEDVSCDLLKVSHHGSRYSSSLEYLKRVSPRYAIISCGKGNSYGHPESRVLKDLKTVQAEIYRTDKLGSIVAVCDGKTIVIESEK